MIRPEHSIRLRGAWEWLDPTLPPVQSMRVDLPIVWGERAPAQPFRLARRFGRPRFDPAVEAVELELADVPGLVAILLNGLEIPLGETPYRIDVGAKLEPRNVLELEVLPGGDGFASPWGSIALVIVGRPA